MSRTHALAFLLATVAALATTSAHAVQRTFVASFGADLNTAANCSLALPCRGFAAAQTVTDNNGEIIVLDSAGYGAVTITKSIAIIAPTGVYGGISVFPGADGVTIATAGVNVVLRGLSINGQGGTNGINMTAGNRLTVENCVISNLTQSGINVNTAATVRVTDTTVRDNGLHGIWLQNGLKGTVTRGMVSGNSSSGIRIEGNLPSTTTTVNIAESTMDGNFNGVVLISVNASAIIKVSVQDSSAVRNNSYGVAAQSGLGALVGLSTSNSIVSNNAIGIGAVNPGTKVTVNGNTVGDNSTYGLYNLSAIFESAGNNTVRNNGANTNGTISIIAAQ